MNLNSPLESPAVNGGDVLALTASATSALTDETPPDNHFTLNQTVVNLFDPNDKTCLEGSQIAVSQIGDYVHYMIRLENTEGTALGSISIYNLLGQLLVVVPDAREKAAVDVTGLAVGTYVVRLVSEKWEQALQFLKK